MASFWLVKSEPGAYSIGDLKRDGTTGWDGVRNFQARNYLRDGIKIGDLILFYHSNAAPMAVVGVARAISAAYPDPTAFDPANEHYDPRSTPEKPQWAMIDIAYVETFSHPVTLEQIKTDPELEGIVLARKGSRLSVQPVSAAHFKHIQSLGNTDK